MNNGCDKLPIFENIYEAMHFISELEYNARDISGVMPIFPNGMDPFVQTGAQLDKYDFIVTRLECKPEDGEYYEMLNIANHIPYLTDFKRYSLKPNLFHSNFLFRGQSQDYGSLKANLFRDEQKSYFLDDNIKVNEFAAFIAQHPLVQLLGIKGFDLLGKNTKFQANLYGLAQHYYNRTPLLDFSSSIEIAAFFATTTMDPNTRSYIPIDNGYESIGIIYALPISTSLAYNRMYGADVSSIGKQFCFQFPEKQLGFLVQSRHADNNLINHKYLLKFRFHHNKQITKEIYESFNRGLSIAPPNLLEHYWKKRDDKNSSFSVSNKAIELNAYFNKKEESPDSIRRKLSEYKFENGQPKFIFSNQDWPEFPREILEDYWNNIKNGWWEDEFCKNIHFPFDDNARMKKALINLPMDPRYRSAFKEI